MMGGWRSPPFSYFLNIGLMEGCPLESLNILTVFNHIENSIENCLFSDINFACQGELKVTQFHYTAWPDHDVPRSATPLIELTMSFRAFVGNDNNVPVLVHCR